MKYPHKGPLVEARRVRSLLTLQGVGWMLRVQAPFPDRVILMVTKTSGYFYLIRDLNNDGMVNGCPALIKFMSGQINLHSITMNEEGSTIIQIEYFPGSNRLVTFVEIQPRPDFHRELSQKQDRDILV